MNISNETVDDSCAMSQYTVIMVDDEQNILLSLKRIFHREPYKFVCAASGTEALKLLSELSDTAVIISDQRMPEMSGSEFLAKSRELAPDAIRMLLTGYSDMEATVAAMNEGGTTHYISKPWVESNLLQTVRDGIRQYHLIMETRRQQEIIKQQNELLIEQNKKLESLAMTDALTGLTIVHSR